MAKITTVEAPGKIAGLEYVNLLINSITHSLDPFMIMCNAMWIMMTNYACPNSKNPAKRILLLSASVIIVMIILNS